MTRTATALDPWKRTRPGALARLKACETAMERTRGTCINLNWYHWMGEWMTAFEWLQKHAPRTAARILHASEQAQ